MDISVELTFSPLQDDFEQPIINLITALRNSGLHIKENPLSTQVYGNYHAVMKVLNTEIETALEAVKHGVLYIKIVKSNRKDYEPDF
ncbi:hypothetical protein [Flavobacterium sp. CS20]|jgi:uncharacterized protein YqgV (UPF0045/DUF77 family)|uniref:hypothetical protein n=1 Tax=Flavobacterium sp. CS20 TaxID=2775246 RepID=UPI001B39E6AB|nr:hypothetical protein [Flavobacterium sp. CS20]QTY26027.1 hypothetical protein IGB25_08430 [Flavobacterium sp. CS20]